MSRFQFNEGKSQSNKKKHGIDFIEAQKIWNSPTFEFPLRGYQEMRYLVLGQIDGAPYTAIVTYLGGLIRIISVRPSNEREVGQYEISVKKIQRKSSDRP
jgi:uncharacterized DUF497 family protein